RSLRPMRHEWEMFFASSGEEALTFLATQSVDVIVADMRMPGMDGMELLTQVRRRHPDVVRITLSGLDQDGLAKAVIGLAHQTLLKPCDTDSLRGALKRALTLREVLDAVWPKEAAKPSSEGEPRVAVDLNQFARNIVEAAREEWESVADVAFELSEGLPPL